MIEFHFFSRNRLECWSKSYCSCVLSGNL